MPMGTLLKVGLFIPSVIGSVISHDGTRLQPSGNSIANDFVVVTEDGTMNGFDCCGRHIWKMSLGRTMVNATEFSAEFHSTGPRMIPAIDGSLFVVFPSDMGAKGIRVAHVNATIMSIVAESPFSTPAFPNAYLTGSKVQSLGSLILDENSIEWSVPPQDEVRLRLTGRRVIYSLNEWTLNCIDTTSQTQRWSLSFLELPSLTQAHLNPGAFEYFQVAKLAREIEIGENVTLSRTSGECGQEETMIHFDSQVLGVYALLDPPDIHHNLALVLVGKNSPVPTSYGGLPEGAELLIESSGGSRIDYTTGTAILHPYRDFSATFPVIKYDYSSITPYNPIWPPIDHQQTTAIPPKRPDEIVSEYKVIDFLKLKLDKLSFVMRIYLTLLSMLFIFMVRKIYKRAVTLVLGRLNKHQVSKSSSSIQIVLPDGTQFNQPIPDQASGAITISSPTSSSNRLVLIPSEALQPYEVVKVGQQDSVEFLPWQRSMDLESFDRKIKDISQRLTKLPFTHSAKESSGDSRRPSLDNGNATVLFLGRNVDEPKLVFRNPRAESEIQRVNVPLYTQSIRNAVAASALRDSSEMRAYVPRALCGSWNTFQGVFQEFIPRNKTVNVSIQAFKESPHSAIDTAILVMLLRDTDAHDGNYIRDLRRKIALFDLGCALADEPLPDDGIERTCLDNFEIWKRVPFLLDTGFEERHKHYIESIDFESLRQQWTLFEYQEGLVEMARIAKSRLVHPTIMLRMMQVHARFLLACIRTNRSVLFAAEVMYSGMYDELWIEVGVKNIDAFEQRLISIAENGDPETLFPHLIDIKGRGSPSARKYEDEIDVDDNFSIEM
jgi:hypothetical protein